jgi:type IV secretory pathway VirJ component
MRPARTRVAAAALVAACWLTSVAGAAASERVDVPVRGKTIALTIYRPNVPTARAKGTVIMGSGDVGWVGLATSMADFLSADGYIVAGVNVRQYLSAFTAGSTHLQPADVTRDYDAIATYLRGHQLLTAPVILSGVSEGAALSVLAASAPANHAWIAGVITMGLPASAEIAWRWSDFTSWISKKDSSEPSFAPRDYIAAVSPLPLAMIQSRKDEYVTEADYRALEAAARAPKKLTLIDAGNHRFTDRIPELRREYMGALAWIFAGSRL